MRDAQDYLEVPARHLNATLGRRHADALWRTGVREVDVLGYCSGGLVALEMAKSLVQLGVDVRTLDIVSSYRIPYLIEDERLSCSTSRRRSGCRSTHWVFRKRTCWPTRSPTH